MSERRYTAQEMRAGASELETLMSRDSIAATMLRQVADVEEELAKVKALLEAVVKASDGLCDEVEFSMSWIDPKANIQHINERIAAYRAARGEGGAE